MSLSPPDEAPTCYNTWQSNKTTATQLSAYIDQVRAQTGSPVIDVVTHSMGALGSRWCKDGVILPNSSAQLAGGARNIRLSIGHNEFLGSVAVFDLLRPIVVD